MFDCLFSFYEFKDNDETIKKNIENCMLVDTTQLKNDLPTALMIERISELLFFNNMDVVSDFLNKLIDSCKNTHRVIYNMLNESLSRINLQNFIFSDENLSELPENVDSVYLLAYSWKCFFENDWIRLEECINKLIQQMNSKSQYFISLVGLVNMVTNHIKIQNHGVYGITKLSNYQKYQKLESEVPLGVYQEELCSEINNLIIEIKEKPNNSASTRIALLRYIMHIETIAIKYWDLGLYLKAKQYMAELHISLTTYEDERGNYAGIASNGKSCIIYSIKSLNNNTISKGLKKEIVGIIENYSKEDFNEIYDYILHKSKKAEWFECIEWLEYLGDNIPEYFVDDLLEWSKKFDVFSKNIRYRFNLNRFNYLESLIRYYELSNKQWDIVESIVFDILVEPNWAQCCDKLCYAILSKAPIENCKKYFCHMTEKCCQLKNVEILPEIIYNSCVERHELIKYGKEALKKISETLNNDKVMKLVEYLSALHISEIKRFDEDEILKHFNSDILSLTPNNSGIHFSYYGDKTFYYRNINWALATTDFADKIFEIFENFINTNEGNINDAYFEIAIGIMRYIVLGLSDNYKKRFINFVMNMIETGYTTQRNPMSSFKDSPISGFKFISSISNFQKYGYLYVLCEFCDVMTENQIEYAIKWCLNIFTEVKSELIYYLSYFFSYVFIIKNNEAKNLAYAGLMMIKATGNAKSGDMYLFDKALKGIEHMFNVKSLQKIFLKITIKYIWNIFYGA